MSKYEIIKLHFRTHKKNGHPSYIYAENKTEKSRMISFSTHDKKNNFKKKKLKGFRIHKADKKTIAKIKKNYRA